ncbi:hypothetical protein [Flectobacillus roseus]|uniref:ABC transporter permease n=1 Tax=Flectobacillus roseus TaxID=502259 RepID=A0ABT6YFM1_9BACT|nr:hypothetical protein [Flectobacillus roseus]MDI9862401.1 hypothetical protein [Flectobacillus roseus]
MVKFILYFLDKFRWFFINIGVDYTSLRAILEVKLLIETRGFWIKNPKASQAAPKSVEDETSPFESEIEEESNHRTFLKTSIIQAVFSFLYAIVIFSVKQTVFNMLLMCFTYMMFMICFNMLADFAEVLFDNQDNTTLLSRPVDPKTIWISRLLHLLIFLGLLTFANAFGLAVVLALKMGLMVGVFFLISVSFLCLISVFISSGLYIFLSKLVNPERFKDIIIYVQIFFTLSLSIGYQFISGQSKISVEDIFQPSRVKFWHYFAPPAWYAHILDSYVYHVKDWHHLNFIFLGILFPIIAMVLINKYLAPFFANRLTSIQYYASVDTRKSSARFLIRDFFNKIHKLFKHSILEKSAFELVWTIVTRDRRFKLRAYPSLGLLILFTIRYYNDTLTVDVNRLMILYYTTFTLSMIVQQIFLSDNWKASWIYQIMPIENPGELLVGAYRSVIIRFIVPLYILITTIMLLKEGIACLKDVYLNISVTLLYIAISVFKESFRLPFSVEASNSNAKGNNWLRFFNLIFVMPMIGLIHYYIAKTLVGTLVIATAFSIIAIILFQQYKFISWERIRHS